MDLFKSLITLVLYIAYTFAFEDAFVDGQGYNSNEMVEKGKAQYQLLQEKGRLPKYGSCWKLAVAHIDEGCRALSEHTQSDIALHLTNCFLAMSGHETYTCELDKKPNLRGICINTMTDRAFNVYTEFYTHTQNMCWFLRGQVWHETITENTRRVGKQLELSAKNQEGLLANQERSLQLQEKMLRYGLQLEKIMEEFHVSTQQHQQLLAVMGTSLGSLQSWLLGEISWLDTIVFYITSAFLIMFITSNNRTSNARLPLMFLIIINIFTERLICLKISNNNHTNNIQTIHNTYYTYVWYIRYFFMVLAALIVSTCIYYYKDYISDNNQLLLKLNSQMFEINEHLSAYKANESLRFIKGTNSCDSVSDYLSNIQNCAGYEGKVTPKPPQDVTLGRSHLSARKKLMPLLEAHSNRYHLRSRQGTPDSNI